MIYDQDSFKEIGLLVIFVNKAYLEKVYSDLTKEVVQNIVITTADYKEIVSRFSNGTYLNESSFISRIGDLSGSFIDQENAMLVSYITMDSPDWKVIIYMSLSQMLKEVGILQYWLIILSIISVLVLSILSIFISRDFIYPINKLIAAMRRVEKGDNSINVAVDRNDELGFLSESFNKMTREIDYLVKWNYKEQITRKEAELTALQSQINPHFLFNTLESINWMARLNNVPQISDTISVLSSLMEAGIRRDDKLITVGEEFQYIDNFIYILKMRFQDRIELRKCVQAEALQILIPRLLIQPLVENAVYHGIENSSRNGIIFLKAVVREDVLTIEVVDNGVGIDSEGLVLLNERLSTSNDAYFRSLSSKSSRSIGIENVNRRIKLFYGENYGLKIESRVDSFTKAAICIPVNGMEMKSEGT